MSEVTALFWDVGGVVLSNGWDRAARIEAARRFKFLREDFEGRHEAAAEAFETGRMTLPAYLDQTIFFRARAFTREEFTSFVLEQSKDNPEVRAVLDELTAARRYFLATINNESVELNAYRIREFHLVRNFTAFFSSCYLGVRKPDERIYRLVLSMTQRAPEECVFIDDRPANLEPARKLGMGTIHFQNPAQLRADLGHYGVRVEPAPNEPDAEGPPPKSAGQGSVT